MPVPDPIIPPWLVLRYPGDQRATLDFLRQRMDDSMLMEIAEADYGQDIEKHYEALLPLWQGGDIKTLDHWYPMEVLELTRWSDVESWDKAEVDIQRAHLIRAYSCAVLLVTPNFEPDKETLVQMLNSMLALGGDAPSVMAGFLTWNVPRLGYEDDRQFFALALAAVPLLCTRGMSVYEEYELEQWVRAEEHREREYLQGFASKYSDPLRFFALSRESQLYSRWKDVIERMKDAGRVGLMKDLMEAILSDAESAPSEKDVLKRLREQVMRMEMRTTQGSK
jgi:hypothetical protein